MGQRAKEAAAEKAAELLSALLRPGMAVGVGTGSTVGLVVEHLLSSPATRRVLGESLLVASSLDTLLRLEEAGLSALIHLPPRPLDVYFDGADEVSLEQGCWAVKGRGAAMTLEKLLAYNSRRSILVVDYSKVSRVLGERGRPVPVEVLRPALHPLRLLLESLGVRVVPRGCDCRDGPAIADNCGVVVDTWPWGRLEATRYEALLDTTPGVVGHGLFIGYFDEAVVGWGDGASVEACRRTRRPAYIGRV